MAKLDKFCSSSNLSAFGGLGKCSEIFWDLMKSLSVLKGGNHINTPP